MELEGKLEECPAPKSSMKMYIVSMRYKYLIYSLFNLDKQGVRRDAPKICTTRGATIALEGALRH